MKLVCSSLISLCIFLISVQAIGAQVINLRINGIGVGARYSTIVKKIGKPVSDQRSGAVPCGDAMRTLRYNGLVLRLENDGSDPLGLYRVDVSSRKWSISGLSIGASRHAVTSKFGIGKEQTENGKKYLSYNIEDGYARFYFNENRLIRVRWEFNFC